MRSAQSYSLPAAASVARQSEHRPCGQFALAASGEGSRRFGGELGEAGKDVRRGAGAADAGVEPPVKAQLRHIQGEGHQEATASRFLGWKWPKRQLRWQQGANALFIVIATIHGSE